jgi:glycine hydroxymethyltransferase
MCDILDNLEDESVNDRVREQVEGLCSRFPVYAG